MTKMLTLFLIAGLIVQFVSAQLSSSCCHLATSNQCRTHCLQMNWNGSPDEWQNGSSWKALSARCPSHMEMLWKCIHSEIQNQTTDDPAEEENQWAGRQCCAFSPVHRCKQSCLRANQTSDLISDCRKSDNIQLFHCLSTLQDGESCCQLASDDAACQPACWSLYKSKATSVSAAGINVTLRQNVLNSCRQRTAVLSCAKSLLKVDRVASPATTLQCCDKGETPQCRQACEKALKNARSSHEVFDALIKDCGPVVPDNALWQCFLRHSPSTANTQQADRSSTSDNGIKLTKQRSLAEMRATSVRRRPTSFDSAKLSCCDRGSPQCNALCRRVYTQDWDEEFDTLDGCMRDPAEAAMSACIKDVDEPCQPGCSGLSFCTNFNHRPMELFRNCNPEADLAAEKMFGEWLLSRRVTVPGWDRVVMSGPSRCSPALWKALACALQFQPCKRNMLRMTICPRDCIDLLSSCLLQRNQTLALELCEKLSPRTGNCVDLQSYLNEQPTAVAMISPCKFNNCDSDHVCAVDQRSFDGYSCLNGCAFGETSKMYGYPKTWIQVPSPHLDCPINSCNEVCLCNQKAEMRQCHTMPFQQFESCSIKNQIYEHGTRFELDCNACVCHFGEAVCTKYHCDYSSETSVVGWSCPLQPELVCSASGRRYLNSCYGQLRQQPNEVLQSCTRPGAVGAEVEDDEFEPDCYTVLKLFYSVKQVDWLLLNTNNASLFSVDLVEQSLRNLLTYSHCHIRVFHSVDGELLAVIHSQLHCTSCTAEAEKLVMFFENRSPQVTLNVPLSVILMAEISQFVQVQPSDPPHSAGVVLIQSTFTIPLSFLISLYTFHFVVY